MKIGKTLMIFIITSHVGHIPQISEGNVCMFTRVNYFPLRIYIFINYDDNENNNKMIF